MNSSTCAQSEFSARSFPNLNETECKRRLNLAEGSGANLKMELAYKGQIPGVKKASW